MTSHRVPPSASQLDGCARNMSWISSRISFSTPPASCPLFDRPRKFRAQANCCIQDTGCSAMGHYFGHVGKISSGNMVPRGSCEDARLSVLRLSASIERGDSAQVGYILPPRFSSWSYHPRRLPHAVVLKASKAISTSTHMDISMYICMDICLFTGSCLCRQPPELEDLIGWPDGGMSTGSHQLREAHLAVCRLITHSAYI